MGNPGHAHLYQGVIEPITPTTHCLLLNTKPPYAYGDSLFLYNSVFHWFVLTIMTLFNESS
mgnify:CR=1 FL=1